jgi:hypothetical protein
MVFALSVSWAICQEGTLNLYKNNHLGIEIPYRNADDFDDEITIVTPESLWVEHAIPEYHIAVRLPQGFTIGKKRPEYTISSPCEGTSLRDSIVVIYASLGKEALTVYQSKSKYYEIFDGFGLADSNYEPIDNGDTTAFRNAVMHQRWVSFGRQDMTEEATYLDGILWKGVRGSNFTGYYTDQGYGGLQRFSRAYLVRQFSEGCNLVCYYFDEQIPANPIRETDFYNIVATIKEVR